ncbi:MAG: AAA family ATPase [bacterium]
MVAGKPVIIWITGECGSGKTTLARSLSRRLSTAFIDNDDLKQSFLHRDVSRRLTGDCVYEAILALARANVQVGNDLIVAAPVCSVDTLARIEALRMCAEVVVINLEAPDATLDERIVERAKTMSPRVKGVRTASERLGSFTHKHHLNVSWATRLNSGKLSVQQLTAAVISLLRHKPHSPEGNEPAGAPSVVELDVALSSREAMNTGRLVVGTGVFDLLHPGHLLYLRACRATGDAVYMHLATDESVRERKGPRRPVLDLESRAAMLLGTRFVDKVFLSELHTVDCAKRLRADVLVVSSEYETEFNSRCKLAQYNGDLVFFPRWQDHVYSTTAIERRLSAL